MLWNKIKINDVQADHFKNDILVVFTWVIVPESCDMVLLNEMNLKILIQAANKDMPAVFWKVLDQYAK